MPTASELVTKIAVEGVDQYARDMGRAETVTDKTAKNMDQAGKQASGLGSSFGSAAKQAGILAAGLGAFDIGKSAIGGLFGAMEDGLKTTGQLQAQLGLTKQEAEALGDTAVQVFRNNFGGSMSEASAAVGQVQQMLGSMDSSSLQTAAENAFRMRDAFGVEVPDSLSAVKTLMDDFGLSSEQAFDFVTSGMQKGLNRSGDFLDTIGEYGTQFKNNGFSAEQFFNVMESGLQGGVLGTDKAADAVKEFGIRFTEMADPVRKALGDIGLNADDIAAKVASGQMTQAEAFQQVITALGQVDDKTKQYTAGQALLGTQFEDLGVDAALALSTVGTSLDETAGKTAALDAQYTGFGSKFETLKRQVITDFLHPFAGSLGGVLTAGAPVMEMAGTMGIAFAGLAPMLLPVITATWAHVTALTAQAAAFVVANAPIILIIGSIALLVAGIVLLVKHWDTITEKVPLLGAAADIAVAGFKGLVEWVGKIASAVQDADLGAKGKEMIEGLWSGVQEAWDTGVTFFTELPGKVLEAIGSVTDTLWQKGQDLIMGLARGYVELWQAEVNFFINLGATVFGAIGDVVSTLWQKGQDLIAGLWRGIQEFWTLTVVPFWDDLKVAVPTLIGIVIDTLWQKGQDLVAGLWRGIQEFWTLTVVPFWDNLKVAIPTLIGNLTETLVQTGKDLIQGFINGVNELWDSAIGFVRNLFQGVIDAVRDVLGVHSESSIMRQIGIDFIQGFISGTGSMAGALKDFVTGLVGNAVSAAREAAGGIAGAVGGAAGALGGAVGGAVGAAATQLGLAGTPAAGDWAGVAAQAANMVGLPEDLIQAIGYHESGGGDLYATGDGGTSHGLFQVHTPAHPSLPRELVVGPEGALRAAREMSSRWQSAFAAMGGMAAYNADPVGFLMRWAPRAQGSDPWSRAQAEAAMAAARRYDGGGGVADGLFTVGERGFELGYKRGNQLHIFSNADSRALISGMSGGARVPGFAAGSFGQPDQFAAAIASPGGWTPGLAAAFFAGMKHMADGAAEIAAEIEKMGDRIGDGGVWFPKGQRSLDDLLRQAANQGLQGPVNELLKEYQAGRKTLEEVLAAIMAFLDANRGKGQAPGGFDYGSMRQAVAEGVAMALGGRTVGSIANAETTNTTRRTV